MVIKLVTVRKITKPQMEQLYKEGYISDIVNFGDKIYAKNVKGMGTDTYGYEIVWCDVP